MSKVRFYVDGLNFYYGVARRYGIKWIDMEKLLLSLVKARMPGATAEKILIFTARVGGNSASSSRRKMYLRALQEYRPSVEVILGEFKSVEKTGVLVRPGNRQSEGGRPETGRIVTIRTYEEKRTDVNLACRIVEDAYEAEIAKKERPADFDAACLVSNDSDLAYALGIKRRLKQKVLLVTPRTEASQKFAAAQLLKHIPKKDRILTIGEDMVRGCLLPDKVGEKYHCPPAWKIPA